MGTSGRNLPVKLLSAYDIRGKFVDYSKLRRPSRFFGAVGLANWVKKGHPLCPSWAPDPGGIEVISRW